MNIGSLGKILKAEVARNPTKTAVLGLLFAVAVWFWFPLIKKWTTSDVQPPVAVAVPVSSAPVAMAPVAAAPVVPLTVASVTEPVGAPGEESIGWEEMERLRGADELYLSIEIGLERLDPFGSHFKQAVVDSDDESPPEIAEDLPEDFELEITPARLGIVVTSTLVAGRYRMATIQGRSFRENDRVKVSAGKAGLDLGGDSNLSARSIIEFVVSRIEEDRVLLERNDKQYWLKLRTSKSIMKRPLVSKGS